MNLKNKGNKTMSRKKILIAVSIFTAIVVVLIIVLNPSHKYNKLSVSEKKWNSIKDSRTENNNLVLEDIRFNDYKLIIDEKSNTLYYSLINDSSNKYNPKVEYNSNNNLKLAVLEDEITDEKIKNNHEFSIMIYNEKEYHIYNLKCTDLPILNISYNQNDETNKNSVPMEIYLFDNLSNIPNKITISRGKLKINDDNYTFSLHMLTPGKNKRDNKLSILNMKPNSEYVLSKVNQDISQEDNLENKKHIVELFLNNEYQGIYLLGFNDTRKQ